ncbi:hypothetical protein Rsub_01726 [Raphidocelis subcapitata]|uniref:Uncharacterized protein n=1 Tax=Raphidocelis subcapitata TaxID=307507 RepID=A0A2V0NVI2_9CHLO|nr:hypothetical protein Rsub_01726 [Raphidocelis subcapitata]|eukprot:GBF88825.1 hypothetical protein Rsub_01726 [Raphidocelis subcapitata]
MLAVDSQSTGLRVPRFVALPAGFDPMAVGSSLDSTSLSSTESLASPPGSVDLSDSAFDKNGIASDSGTFAVFGPQLCHPAGLLLDVASPPRGEDSEQPIANISSPTGAGAAAAPGSPAFAAPDAPLFWLQQKGSGGAKVKGRLRGPAGACVACFDHAPGCPAGSAYRLFVGGRCHSSFRVGAVKVSALRGETCIKVQLRGLPYVGIVITGDIAGRTFKVLQHMPGRRTERLLASATPSPAGPAATRVRVCAGVDAAFAVCLAAVAAEAAACGGLEAGAAAGAVGAVGCSSAATMGGAIAAAAAAAAAQQAAAAAVPSFAAAQPPPPPPPSGRRTRSPRGSSGGRAPPSPPAAGAFAQQWQQQAAAAAAAPWQRGAPPAFLQPAQLAPPAPAGPCFAFPQQAAAPPSHWLSPAPPPLTPPLTPDLPRPAAASPLMLHAHHLQLLQAMQQQEAARLQAEILRLELMQHAPPPLQPAASGGGFAGGAPAPLLSLDSGSIWGPASCSSGGW